MPYCISCSTVKFFFYVLEYFTYNNYYGADICIYFCFHILFFFLEKFDVLCFVYSSFYKKKLFKFHKLSLFFYKLSIKYQSYPKSGKIVVFEQIHAYITTLLLIAVNYLPLFVHIFRCNTNYNHIQNYTLVS